MIFVIVRSCIRKITLVRVSISVTGNPKILMINVYASYVYPCQPPPPRCSVKPLHLRSNVRDPYPTGPSQVAMLPHLKRKTKMYRLAISCRASTSGPPHPILICSTKKNYFLITYQTGDCCHGNNDTNHYYRRYPQAGPVSWTVEVDMIMIMSYCLIPILYHGFVHG